VGFYAEAICSLLPTLQENLSVPSSRVKESSTSWTASPFQMGMIVFLEVSVKKKLQRYAA